MGHGPRAPRGGGSGGRRVGTNDDPCRVGRAPTRSCGGSEPLVHWSYRRRRGSPGFVGAESSTASPLANVKVLDLTRVLAGPVARGS